MMFIYHLRLKHGTTLIPNGTEITVVSSKCNYTSLSKEEIRQGLLNAGYPAPEIATGIFGTGNQYYYYASEWTLIKTEQRHS